MSDESNFRSNYYQKFKFIGIEEKKSVEILLKDQSIDVNKLKQFCLRFPLPAVYRNIVWKVVLGVVPEYHSIQELAMSTRTTQYLDTIEALQSMKKIRRQTPQAQIFLNVHLLQEGKLPFEDDIMLTDAGCRMFMALADCMAQVIEDEVEAYCLTCYFKKMLDRTMHDTLHLLPQKTEQCLKKENQDGKLYHHFIKLQAFRHIPLMHWFILCFAGVLPETSFERIWDKVIGGSCMILVYVAVSILLTFKRPLLSMDNIEDILNYLEKLPPDSGDIIVTKAIDLWQTNGSQLLPSVHTQGGSPKITDSVASC